MSDSSGEPGALTPAPENDAPIKTDLYCLECGYNLRGLSGDPVRCPECGNFNPVALIEVPADAIRRQLRKMESAPTLSVVGMLLAALFTVPLVIMLFHGKSSEGILCPTVALSLGLLLWIGGVARFWGSCLGKAGWLAALLRFQAVAVVLIAGIGVTFGAGFKLALAVGWSPHGSGKTLMLMLMIMVLVIAAVSWLLRPLHRWLKTPMERLQREVAVEIARESVRKQMHREKRWINRR